MPAAPLGRRIRRDRGEDTVLIVALAVLVAALLEVLLALLLPGRPHPGAVLLAALAVGLRRGPVAGALAAFGGGLLLDAFAGPPLGRQALALTLAASVLCLPGARMAPRSPLASALAGGLATLVYWAALGIVDSSLGMSVPWPSVLLRYVAPSLLLNALLAWPLPLLAPRRAPRARAGTAAW